MNIRQGYKPAAGSGDMAGLSLSPLSIAVLFALGALSRPAMAREYFDPGFLSGGLKGADLSAYENAGYIPPGRYMVDVYMNQILVESRNVTFREEKGRVIPEFTVADLDTWGVNTDSVGALAGKPATTSVTDLASLIPQAGVRFNFASLRLDVSVPQASMQEGFDPDMNPALWDQGIPALMSNYSVNGGEGRSNNDDNSTKTHNLFASFRNGLNAGPWRLRTTQTFTMTDQKTTGHGAYGDYNESIPTERSWRSSDTYVQRDVQTLRADLTMGEGNTSGDVLDSVPFRGVQLKSEDSMLPNSRTGFAPVISGTANSNAVVRVRQNGYTIYQVNVAPGPFRITDMGQAGSNGDLQVEVTEADGSRHVSTVAYSTLPVMQRQGGFDYEVTVGQYRSGNVTDGSREPNFAMASLVYGLPADITLYGGVLGASNYLTGSIGSALSLGVIGAVSLDATWAKAKLQNRDGGDEQDETGGSYRLRYSKNMLTTGTSVDLATYRYSTRNYYSFSDANSQGYSLNSWSAPWAMNRQRSSWQVTLSQQLPASLGSVYVTGSRSEYWGDEGTDTSMRAGYGTSIKGVSLSVNYDVDRMQERDNSWPENRQLSMNVSVPFSLFSPWEGLRSINSNYSMTHDNKGRVTQQAGVSGSLLDGRLGYGANQGWGNSGMQDSSSLTLNWMGSRATGNLGYSNSGDSKNFNYGVSGGLLVHPYGMTMSRSLGDGGIVVRAPGASGVTVNGYDRTDWRGFAVLPGGGSYRKTAVSLDPSTLPDGVELDQTSKNVYPTRGAVVLADFKVRSGSQVLLNLLFNGQPVPFGAMASLEGNDDQASTGIVGDAGRVYLSGMPASGSVTVKWGQGADQQCRAQYSGAENTLISRDHVVCQ
ncbi:fimbria/pilus outer membrane usher protein [Enterobacter ludwigii]|uniref:fimbria/pilus outer membrane usher protein n=1 Tax=Enterobacter ludwigii TaxID=299767 RepID=UPI0018682FA4|nr:fimbria/pilus outer membrane usher protein [Enterobacter ludwigii]